MPLPKDNMLFGFANKLTEEQRKFVNAIFDKQLVIVNARSGTGKTTLAVACAKILDKPLVYIFSPVMEGSMGFRPVTQEEKESEYIVPLLDALSEIKENPKHCIYREDNPDFINKGTWVFPRSHIFARGTNIKDSVVIIDECQNFTKQELRKVLTRIHDTCKVIMIGHTGQIDLKNAKDSGFKSYIEHFKEKEYAELVELSWNFRGKLANDADEIG
jgi:predicted ribonuclease YlaK